MHAGFIGMVVIKGKLAPTRKPYGGKSPRTARARGLLINFVFTPLSKSKKMLSKELLKKVTRTTFVVCPVEKTSSLVLMQKCHVGRCGETRRRRYGYARS